MKNTIKKEIKELALYSTAYGVPNLFRSKEETKKIFWLCFLLISSGVSTYYIYIAIFNYLEYDVVTIVKSEYDQPTPFPTITFCNRVNDYFKDYKPSQFIANISRFGYDFDVGTNPDNHFEAFISEDFGKCFRFNSGKNLSNHSIPIKNSTIGGRDDCFLLQLDPKFSFSFTIWIHER